MLQISLIWKQRNCES